MEYQFRLISKSDDGQARRTRTTDPAMTRPRPAKSRAGGRPRAVAGPLLVGLQFGLIAVLAMQGLLALQRGPAWPWLLAAAALALAGAALGLAALAANRPGNFNIHPAPRHGGRLVAHGPYRWIRHPMYAAVLLLGGAAALMAASAAATLAWAALLVVLLAKAALEERWLAMHHAGYADYRQGTWRLLPGVF
jgi:protein-S-isoprenylcysteine O-methyltransferase Ste14